MENEMTSWEIGFEKDIGMREEEITSSREKENNYESERNMEIIERNRGIYRREGRGNYIGGRRIRRVSESDLMNMEIF